jgi:hypothetical protein
METLGDVQHFIDENSDDAHQLALSQLAITDLDILSSSAALQYLCLVYVLKHNGGREALKSIYDAINGEYDSNGMLADVILEQAKTLPFMQSKKKTQETVQKLTATTVLRNAMKNASISIDDIRKEFGDQVADLVAEK